MSRWRYDREFVVESLPVSGRVRIAFKMVEPWDTDDPLHGLAAWIRLVIWTNADGSQIPDVNMASDLRDLLRANLQTFKVPETGTEYRLYLTDYESGRFETKPGGTFWEGEIVPPTTFLEYLDRDERRRAIQERRTHEGVK